MPIILGMPASVLSLFQSGLLERAFHDGLMPALLYRGEAMVEEHPANTGTEIFMSRPGLLAPATTPLVPGVDPTAVTVSWEQWVARLERYGSAIDTHMPTAVVTNSNLFLRHIHQLGLQAGQTLNRVPRNSLFTAYLSGSTATTASQINTDTTIHVASMNGFTDVIVQGGQVRPVAVSAANPLPIKIMMPTPLNANVIAFQPDNPADLNGPGVLTLAAQIGGAGCTARTPILASNGPRILRAGGGNSVDALSASDTITIQDVINAAAQLRRASVQPHEDGFYHAHIAPLGEAQFFADPAFKQLYQGQKDAVEFKQGFLGELSGVRFWMNPESPEALNCGTQTATGVNAKYSKDIGAETTNETSVPVGRVIVTGKASIYERFLDENQYISEAGVTGKVGEFDVTNNGIQVLAERIRLVLRSPIDRMQDVVSAAWSYSGCFPIPSDVTATSGPERFKRAIVIEYAS